MTKATNSSISNVHFTLLGLMYGRGDFVGNGENCIALYFLPNEFYFIETVKELLPFYLSQKSIVAKKLGGKKIEGIYFSRKTGKDIKKAFNVCKEDLKSRNIPDIVFESGEENLQRFLSGWLSTNIKVKNKGLFKPRPCIIFTDSCLNVIRRFSSILESMGIENKIKDKSSQTYKAFGEEFTKASELIIDKENVYKLIDNIGILDPGKSCLILPS